MCHSHVVQLSSRLTEQPGIPFLSKPDVTRMKELINAGRRSIGQRGSGAKKKSREAEALILIEVK